MSQKLVIGLISLALAVCLTACSGKCIKTRPVLPPAVLMQHVPEPQLVGNKNSDLLNWALKMRVALQWANSDKTALREWGAKMGK